MRQRRLGALGTVDNVGGNEVEEEEEAGGKAGEGKGINLWPAKSVTIECTEARKEGKSPSRYMTTRNKKLKTEKIELKKYNPALRRHTVHREIK